jgi:hypothetical protein
MTRRWFIDEAKISNKSKRREEGKNGKKRKQFCQFQNNHK